MCSSDLGNQPRPRRARHDRLNQERTHDAEACWGTANGDDPGEEKACAGDGDRAASGCSCRGHAADERRHRQRCRWSWPDGSCRRGYDIHEPGYDARDHQGRRLTLRITLRVRMAHPSGLTRRSRVTSSAGQLTTMPAPAPVCSSDGSLARGERLNQPKQYYLATCVDGIITPRQYRLKIALRHYWPVRNGRGGVPSPPSAHCVLPTGTVRDAR